MSNTFPIEELRSLLEKARATDANLKQFGAEHHKYQWNPPASLKEIEKFEKETGISLPDGYRNFLLQAGNGGAGPFYGLFSLEQVKGWLSWQVEPGETPYLAPGYSSPGSQTFYPGISVGCGRRQPVTIWGGSAFLWMATKKRCGSFTFRPIRMRNVCWRSAAWTSSRLYRRLPRISYAGFWMIGSQRKMWTACPCWLTV